MMVAIIKEVCFSLVDLYPQYLLRRYVTQGLSVLTICLRHITRVNSLPLNQPCRLPATRCIFQRMTTVTGWMERRFPNAKSNLKSC